MKRSFDLLVAWMAVIVLAPLFGVIAVLVWLKLGQPILFRQERPGLNHKSFNLLKFRTMLDRLDDMGNPLPDSARLTTFGRWLRATSLDELPELWNIIRGEMSLVGPRPLLVEYLPLYSVEQAMRHDVRPGLTGWAQINGRNALGWDEKFKLDLWYIKNQSFWLDIKIIILTFVRVFRRDGISEAGEATMSRFTGPRN